MAVPAPQHALAHEAESLERRLRAGVLDVGVRPEALEAQVREREVGDQRLHLAGSPRSPTSGARATSRHGAAVAARELGEADDTDRAVVAMDDQQIELLAALAPVGEPDDVRDRLLDAHVRPPREEARHLAIASRARTAPARPPVSRSEG